MAELKETITDLFVQLNPHNQAGFLQKMRDFDVYSKIDLSEDEFNSMANRKKLKLKITKLFSQLNPKHQQGFLDQMQAVSMASSVSSSSSNKKRPHHHLEIGPSKRRRLSTCEKMTGGIRLAGMQLDSDSDSEAEAEAAADNEIEVYDNVVEAPAGARDSNDSNDEERMRQLLNVGEIVSINYYEDELNTNFNDDIIFENLCKVLRGESQMFQGKDRTAKLERWVKNLIQLKNDTSADRIDDNIKPILHTTQPIDVKWIVPVSQQNLLTDNVSLSELTIAQRLEQNEDMTVQENGGGSFKEMFLTTNDDEPSSKFIKGIVDDKEELLIKGFLVASSYFTSPTGNEVMTQDDDDMSALVPTLQDMLRVKKLQNFLKKSFGLGVSHLKKLAHQRLLFQDYEITAAHKMAFLQLIRADGTVKRLKTAVEMDEKILWDCETEAAAAADTAKEPEKITFREHDIFLDSKQEKLASLRQLVLKDENPFRTLTIGAAEFFQNYKSLNEKLHTDFQAALENFESSRAPPPQLKSGELSLTPKSTIVVSNGSSILYGPKTRFERLQDTLDAILSMPIVDLEKLQQFLDNYTFQADNDQWYKDIESRQNILCVHRYNQAHSIDNTLLFEYHGDEKVCRVCKQTMGADIHFATLAYGDDGKPKDFFGVEGIATNGTIALGAETPFFVRGTQYDTWSIETSSLQMSVYKHMAESSPAYKMEKALNEQLNKKSELVRYKKLFLYNQQAKQTCIDQCLHLGKKITIEQLIQIVKQTTTPLLPPISRNNESCVNPKDDLQILTFPKQHTQVKLPQFKAKKAEKAEKAKEALLSLMHQLGLNIVLPDPYKKVLAMPRITAEFYRTYTKLKLLQQSSAMFKNIPSALKQFNDDLGTSFQRIQSIQIKPPNTTDLPDLTQLKTLDEYMATTTNVNVMTLLLLFVHNMAKKMVAENKSMEVSKEIDQCSKDAIEHEDAAGEGEGEGEGGDGGTQDDDGADLGTDGNADDGGDDGGGGDDGDDGGDEGDGGGGDGGGGGGGGGAYSDTNLGAC
jgi:hypothetical protein